MTKQWEDNFEALLAWLDPDREQAGVKYEEIRHTLIHIFSWRGRINAEDLADETINRVTRKVLELAPNYNGDPSLYFFGVAKKMVLEIIRREPPAELPESDKLQDLRPAEPNDSENVHECLDQCLSKLTAADRELILLYHQQEKPTIEARKQLARRTGISANNLRVKAHRIRAGLHKCIEECLKQKTAVETD